MTISVDIADRLFDYTDEEAAASAIARFQEETHMDDHATIALWGDEKDPRRNVLEKAIYQAIDANGPAKRALETVPAGVSLAIDGD